MVTVAAKCPPTPQDREKRSPYFQIVEVKTGNRLLPSNPSNRLFIIKLFIILQHPVALRYHSYILSTPSIMQQ
jgi:hypothetical protein